MENFSFEGDFDFLIDNLIKIVVLTLEKFGKSDEIFGIDILEEGEKLIFKSNSFTVDFDINSDNEDTFTKKLMEALNGWLIQANWGCYTDYQDDSPW